MKSPKNTGKHFNFYLNSGAYIYLLSPFGLLKMGTGLSETRAGEVLTCNELLKYSDGSGLFISNESLYLRRRHSSRLWVLDTDNLREIGEIMYVQYHRNAIYFHETPEG